MPWRVGTRKIDVYAHHVVEDEAGVGQFEVFDQAVELPAVEGTPGAVQVFSGLRLLPSVVVVLELDRKHRRVRKRQKRTSTDLKQRQRLRW